MKKAAINIDRMRGLEGFIDESVRSAESAQATIIKIGIIGGVALISSFCLFYLVKHLSKK
jgi:hypothetical protein